VILNLERKGGNLNKEEFMKMNVILSVVVLSTLLSLLIPVGVHAERKIVWITGYT